MGGVEDEEPATKRTKLSPNSSSSMEHVVGSTSDLMAPPLSAEGDDEVVGTKGSLKRREFVRMITKAMYSLGYKKSGEHLEEESGIPLNSSAVNLFMQQVLDGDWDESLATLKQIGLEDESIVKAASVLILEQKFFELIDGDKVIEALNTLRNQITQLCVDSTRIRELSSCFLSPSGQGGSSGRDFVRAKTRLKLLEELQKLFPSTVMIPEKRLEHLVEQALTMERVASTNGLWPSPASDSVDLSAYKLRFGDFVHAFLSVVVFAVLGLLDTNVVHCFYPKFESSEKILMQVLPPVIGVVSGAVFMIFPSYRHGIGYPTSSDTNDTSEKTT